MNAKPFFDEKLLRTDSQGNYESFSGSKRVRFFEDRVELGRIPIHYAFVAHLEAVENTLHIGYRVSDGTVAEEYLRLDAMTRVRASRRLQDAVARAAGLVANLPQAAIEVARAQVAATPVIAQAKPSVTGRAVIEVRDPEVLFPLQCPRCTSEATSVDVLHVSRGLAHKAAWLVPVCDNHPRVGDSIRVTRWAALVSGVEFSFAHAGYAELFRSLNQDASAPATAAASRLSWEVNRGTRFVVFQFALSALFISLLVPSAVHKIPPGQSATKRSVTYTVLSLLLGWWAIPGPFFTIRAVRTNLKGGIDLTEAVRELTEGVRSGAHALA